MEVKQASYMHQLSLPFTLEPNALTSAGNSASEASACWRLLSESPAGLLAGGHDPTRLEACLLVRARNNIDIDDENILNSIKQWERILLEGITIGSTSATFS